MDLDGPQRNRFADLHEIKDTHSEVFVKQPLELFSTDRPVFNVFSIAQNPVPGHREN